MNSKLNGLWISCVNEIFKMRLETLFKCGRNSVKWIIMKCLQCSKNFTSKIETSNWYDFVFSYGFDIKSYEFRVNARLVKRPVDEIRCKCTSVALHQLLLYFFDMKPYFMQRVLLLTKVDCLWMLAYKTK